MRIPLHQFLMAALDSGPTTPDTGSLADAATVDPNITLDTSSPPPGLAADFVSPAGGVSLMLSDAGMPSGAAPWTLCGWVQTSGLGGFFGWGTLGDADFTYVQFYIGDEGPSLCLKCSSGGWIEGTANVTDGNWHHVAATFDGATIRFFVDGESDTTTFNSMPSPGNTLPLDIALGGTLYIASDYAGTYFDGSMADFRVYDYALSLGEINAIYNAQSTDPGNVWGYPAAAGASIPGSMGALVNTIGNAAPPSTSQIAAAILANPSNLLNTDNSGGALLSTSQTFDGVSTQSLLELLVAAFVTGKATVVNNGNGTSTIIRYKQDGSTAKYSVTFKLDGTITGAAILV